MPSFMSASKAVGRLILGRNGVRQLINYNKGSGELGNHVQIRWLSSIACIERFPLATEAIGGLKKDAYFPIGSMCNGVFQRRGFLGCGDGEEGNVLAKVYEERRVLGYSPEQLYSVVAAVDLYADFVPWCQRSDIVRRFPDGSFDAELEIGFKFLVESYMSHVELKKPKYIKTTASESGLFDHLINIWEFNPGPVPGSCSLYFLVDFKFQSPFYRQMATMFFKEVATRLHGNIFKMQRKRKCRKAGSHSTLTLLRRELREGNLQSLFGGSSYLVSSTNVAPDPLLSSFILPMADDFGSAQSHSSAESTSIKKSSNESVSERTVQSSPLSIKDQEERTRRCEFVQGLLLSTILDDKL